MLSEDEREGMRRAYSIDHLKVSQIARGTGHCRQTVKDVDELYDAATRKLPLRTCAGVQALWRHSQTN